MSYSLVERTLGQYLSEFWSEEESRHTTLHDLCAFFVNHLSWQENLRIHIATT